MHECLQDTCTSLQQGVRQTDGKASFHTVTAVRWRCTNKASVLLPVSSLSSPPPSCRDRDRNSVKQQQVCVCVCVCVWWCSETTSTFLCFKFKMHQYCCVSVHHPHWSSILAAQRRSSLETLLSPFYFENSGTAFHCGWAEMEVFGNAYTDALSDWSCSSHGTI